MALKNTVSERRLAANRANAQLSTGPKTPAGKAQSSLNAVKTGLCGRTLVLADEDEAARYRAHVARLLEYWEPGDVREHALVQSLADTQWRLESIPGLEAALYALGRRRYAELFADVEDLHVRRALLDAHTETVDAPAFKNLRLHERRLERRYWTDEADLDEQRTARMNAEERQAEEEQQKAAEAQHRQQEEEEAAAPQRPPQTEGRKAREQAVQNPNGFEFTTPSQALPIPHQSLSRPSEPRTE